VTRDVPECFPWMGNYKNGCDFVENMCELSSYKDDPMNPSWCTSYTSGVLNAWQSCETDIRWNPEINNATHIAPYDEVFVECLYGKMESPDCDGMCELHSGACQNLCGELRRCLPQCKSGRTITGRYQVFDCVNDCLRAVPPPPTANETWPHTPIASFPPHIEANMHLIRNASVQLEALQEEYDKEKESLENETAATDVMRNQIFELLKSKFNPGDPAVAPLSNDTNATVEAAPVLEAAEAADQEFQAVVATTAAPLTEEELLESSPILKSMQSLETQVADLEAERQRVALEHAELASELESLKLQLG